MYVCTLVECDHLSERLSKAREESTALLTAKKSSNSPPQTKTSDSDHSARNEPWVSTYEIYVAIARQSVFSRSTVALRAIKRYI